MKTQHKVKLDETEVIAIGWMYGFKLNERKRIAEIGELLDLELVSLVIKKGRLRWFGCVERKDDADWVKCCMMIEVDRTRRSSHPMKICWDCVREDDGEFGPVQRGCRV